MATYNGERFLERQLASIAGQTLAPCELVVRDDGSSDATMQILRQFAQVAPFPVIVANEAPALRLGPAYSFGRALAFASGDLVCLADQDDEWLPDKLAVLHKRVQEVTAQSGPAAPILVHHDLHVIDAEGNTLHPSMNDSSQLQAEATPFKRRLLQNTVTGCASMFNRALLLRALPFPPVILMHDHWLALVAACSGRVVFEPACLARYRQHGHNVVGWRRAPGPWRLARSTVIGLLKAPFAAMRDDHLAPFLAQAAALDARCGGEAPADNRRAIARFIALADAGRLRRILRVFAEGYRLSSTASEVGFVLRELRGIPRRRPRARQTSNLEEQPRGS